MKSEKAIVIGIVFTLAMLAFVGSASATTYYVNPGESIQNAVNAANSGDTIIVRDGTYTENVYVNKRLTIRSENGPETTIVRAAFSLAHVLTVTADYVNISGFTVRQVSSPSGYYASAIVLKGANGCKISKNKVDFASWSISLSNSKNNIIENNTVIHAGTGIGLSLSSKYNIVRNNTVEWTNIGICVRLGSHENTITRNKIINNRWYGIKLERSNSNIIYLNDFMNNNRGNTYSADSTNIWNATRRLTYTYDGNTYTNYLGNYWDGYSGTDNNNDGIGDTPYPIDSDKDNYPLMEPRENYFVTPTELPDLTLSPEDITFSNPNPAVGETVAITAAIHNIGNADATDVIVQFFDGNLDTGGTQIGDDQTIASINAGGTGTAQVDWTATSGSHDIYVVVDPYNDISEPNENNNEAHITCVIEPKDIIRGNVEILEGTRVVGIPVYVYQKDIPDPICFDITDENGYYEFDLSDCIKDTTKDREFYVEARWENDTVKIHDYLLIGSEVIRERRPAKGLLNEDRYEGIPQDGMWEDIVFDDGDALRDYQHARIIFEAINDAFDYVNVTYEYEPSKVNVYIHDWTTNPTCTSWIDGAIHFSTIDEDYTHSVSYHEYGHAIHFQHGAGLRYPRKMQEGWAIYFESLFPDDRFAGDYLEDNRDYCWKPFNSYDHDWGIVYARIFHDLYDGVDSSDFDNFDNGESRIWQTFMEDKVETIDEFYNNFIENQDEKEAVRSIYARKKIKAPDYNGNFINVNFPTDINQGELAIIDFTVKNYADYSDSYDVVLALWDIDGNFLVYGEHDEGGGAAKRVDIDANSELSGNFKWIVDADSSGVYRILLAIVPINWILSGCCLDFYDYENGWIDYKSIVQTITLNSDLSAIGECPIDLEIVDPDGFTIKDQSNNIPRATYTETDINGDGDPDDIIIIPDRKVGNYQITVTPEPDAEDTDTYTLKVSAGDTTIVLAEDVMISNIPDQPYIIESTETTINAAPVADCNGPYAGDEGSQITFDASGSYDPDGSIDLYEWDFDSDGAYDVSSTSSTAIFTWGDDYTGTVELQVTDNAGLSGTGTASIMVNNVAPTASFYVEQPEDFTLPYHSLTFNGASTDAGWLDTHAATWDFGDGTNVSGTLTPIGTTTAEHAYVKPGTYTVTLTVTDDDAGVGDYAAEVTVISAEVAAGMIIDQLAVSIVPAEAPKGVSQKIESAIDKLEQVIDFLDQGKYCDAIGKLDGMITQIEGAIDQVNEQRCSVKECKGEKCNCIADVDADKLIKSLEHAKQGAIAIGDLISTEHPECA